MTVPHTTDRVRLGFGSSEGQGHTGARCPWRPEEPRTALGLKPSTDQPELSGLLQRRSAPHPGKGPGSGDRFPFLAVLPALCSSSYFPPLVSMGTPRADLSQRLLSWALGFPEGRSSPASSDRVLVVLPGRGKRSGYPWI